LGVSNGLYEALVYRCANLLYRAQEESVPAAGGQQGQTDWDATGAVKGSDTCGSRPMPAKEVGESA
jgi:hypothetical protein